ncbi:hypothetical protein RJ640_009536, partial [Escallonia rubra]
MNVIKPRKETDVTPRQCSSIVRVERKNNVVKECHGIIKNFQEKAMYVNSNTMLNEFVVIYDKEVYNWRHAEEDEDFKTVTSKAVLSSDHLIEQKAEDSYTRSLFEIFKKEWNATVSCSQITWSKEPNITKYKVGLINVVKEKWQTVYYYSSKDVRAICSCAKFDTAGILCKHKKKIIDLPQYYILPRWTINARYKVGDVGDRTDEISRYSTEKGFSKAIENARNSPSEICEVDSWLTSFLKKQAARKNEENLIGGKM